MIRRLFSRFKLRALERQKAILCETTLEAWDNAQLAKRSGFITRRPFVAAPSAAIRIAPASGKGAGHA